jgi:hypothetical protein
LSIGIILIFQKIDTTSAVGVPAEAASRKEERKMKKINHLHYNIWIRRTVEQRGT